MLQRFRHLTMPLALTTGILFSSFFASFAFITPLLLFFMLLFSCCAINPHDIKLKKQHFLLLLVQAVGAVLAYFAIIAVDSTLAQGALLCFLMPTATSGVVTVAILEGKTASLLTYTLFYNIVLSVAAPFVLAAVGDNPELSFWQTSAAIAWRTLSVLLAPMALAFLLRRFALKVNEKLSQCQDISFSLWLFALVVVSAQITQFIAKESENSLFLLFSIALVSLFCCLVQFIAGRFIGSYFDDKVSCAQSLGQKNTVMGIWLANSCLNPLASLAPGAYVLWQGIVNSWQIWKIKRS